MPGPWLQCIAAPGHRGQLRHDRARTLDVAVKECVAGALSYNGQRCTAIKLIFAHESVADPFLERLVAAVGKLRAGMAWDEGVDLTPLPEDGKPA